MIETQRLVLRPFKETDLDASTNILVKSRFTVLWI